MTEKDPRFLSQHVRTAETRVLHLRFEGRSRDIALDILDVTSGSSDDAIRQSVAAFLDVGLQRLAGTVIERHENGNLTLRPEAVFG